MGSALKATKDNVMKMFELSTEVLSEHNIKPGSYLLKFGFYRNYNSPEDEILQHSGWESKPSSMTGFMNGITTRGGCGNEAVEVALAYALTEHEKEELKSVLLIGDASPNTEEEIKTKRATANWSGLKKWGMNDKEFKVANEFAKELGGKNVPIFSFWIKRYEGLERSFKELSASSGGEGSFLDVQGGNGAQHLLEVVSKQIIKNVAKAHNKDMATVMSTYDKVLKKHLGKSHV